MFSADQFIAHALGDYILQSDWMAREKYRNTVAALCHVVFYTLPFLFLTQNPWTLVVIAGTHFVIDRWRLARHLAWIKNRAWPGSRPWAECADTGYPPDMPAYASMWLLIIVDNIMHIIINGLAITYIG